MKERRANWIWALCVLALLVFSVPALAQGPCEIWNWANPLPQGNALHGVAANGSTVVAVGAGGTVMRSTDGGANWSVLPQPTTRNLNAVVWNGSQFVAVGDREAWNVWTILTSPDGLTWTLQSGPSGTARNLNGVDWNATNTLFAAVGDAATILTSPDGSTWTAQSAPAGVTANLNAVASDTGFMVAAGQSGTVLTTNGSGFGTTWTDRTAIAGAGGQNLYGAAATSGLAMVVGSNGTIRVATSATTWVGSTSLPARNWRGAFFSGSLWFIMDGNGTIRVTSGGPDPTTWTWTDQNTPTIATMTAACYTGSQYVAVGFAGDILTGLVTPASVSPEDLSWTRRTSGNENNFRSVAWGGPAGSERYVAVATRGTVLTSADGVTWTQTSPPPPPSRVFQSVTWGGGQFVAVGNHGLVMTSPDGLAWTDHSYSQPTEPTNPNLRGVAWGGGLYVAVGGGVIGGEIPYAIILTSIDGTTWTPASLPAGWAPRTLNSATWVPYPQNAAGGFFLAVGDALNSTTGTFIWDSFNPTGTWADISDRYVPASGNARDLNAVIAGGGPDNARDYLIVGDGGTILYSYAGSANLFNVTSGTSTGLFGALWDGCDYVVVGGAGLVLTSPSPDGTFTRMPTPTVGPLYGVASDPAGYAAVGAYGNIIHASKTVANPTVPVSAILNTSVDFSAAPSGGGGGYNVMWDFGDGGTDTGNAVSHTYTATGTYTWSVTVTDCSGMVGCASGTIDIYCPVITLSPASLAGGTVGSTYQQFISASGGAGPYTYSVTPDGLPVGLTLDPSTGEIHGTPIGAAGTSFFTITATDADGCKGSMRYSIEVLCPVISLRGVLYGADNNGALFTIDTATGAGTPVGTLFPPEGCGEGPGSTEIEYDPTSGHAFCQYPDGSFLGWEFDIATGTPTGTCVNDDGALQGIEAVDGVWYATVLGPAGPGSYLCTFDPSTGGLTVIGPTGWGPISGLAYDTATRIMYGITGGAQSQPSTLLTIDLATGTATEVGLTGMAASGSLQFGPSGRLYAGGGQSDSGQIWVIDKTTGAGTYLGDTGSEFPISGLTLVGPSDPPDGVVGKTYSYTFSPSGGTAPYTYLAVDPLPDGLTLDQNTGEVSGTPTKAGTYTFRIIAFDAYECTGEAQYSITVVCPSITIAGVLYGADNSGDFFRVDTTTGAGTSIGVLNPPANCEVEGPGSTEIQYDPVSGRAFNQSPDGDFLGWEFDLTTGDSIGACVTNGHSFQGLEAVGGVWYGTAVDEGGAPSTLYIINPFTGTTSSIGPTGFGPISGLAYDASSETMYGITGGGESYLLTIDLTTGAATEIGPTGMQASGSLAFGPDGRLYAGGGQSNSGQIWVIDKATGVGTYLGDTGFEYPISGLTLYGAGPAPPDGVAGETYSFTFDASGGTGPYTYALKDGALPDGLNLAADGTISGTPTVVGTFTITVTATDSYGCQGEQTLSFTIACPDIQVTPDVLPSPTLNQPYNATLGVTGGIAPFTYTVSTGDLPPGLTLSSDGVLSGTPTASGLYTFTVTVTDKNECTGEREYSLYAFSYNYYDDGGTSQACLDVETGYFVWYVAGGPSFTGTLQVYNGGTMFWSPSGASQYVYLYYDPNNHTAWGYLYDYTTGLYSSLYDTNTLNNPPCGSLAAPVD